MQTPRALVTGGARRLGRAMALRLAQRGFGVAVHYNSSAEDAEATVDAIRAEGGDAAALHADLLSERDVGALVPEACRVLGGPLTVLINNASIFERDTLTSATRESWDRHLGSNLRAPFVLTQAFAAQAPRAGVDSNGEPRAQALVVNMVDQRVLKPTPEFMTYTIAKTALWSFTRTAAQALAPDIRVNAIGPGPTVRAARQSEAHFLRQRAATVLGRGASEEDVCVALAFLLDSPGVTGQMMAVDGGQHLVWKTQDILGG